MRLLLVDDEEELIAPLQQVLTNQGYGVDIASNGKQGWEMARSGGYDLLILDWMMADMSGIEICQHLRQVGDSTPVLFLTAKDTLDDRVAGLDSGADDYLVKPFELRELLARVRALLRRSPIVETQRLTYKDLELDRNNQVAYRRGQPIALSEKEYQLLEYFMRHPNQLLTHEQIQQHLWSPDETPVSNALVAQIRLLRRKIDGNAKSSLIATVYGKGYRFG
ncbi:two component transcriptional regulator, winged helix family [Thalassoporum mexicanum PCC 7367]|uniref:two-component system response regulator RppA n=1 Tax=Thalassoporum mexicanum TaxID=3457544 RepID=UPI00029FC19D|nr:two-component system response regulator RppA [Pseudanabaena sp. PCC 7367]AFY68970.1 two component transcriptional regulator, winged helix family [Pseudanabaena sp. PCC 7367]